MRHWKPSAHLPRVKRALKSFHKDQEGLEALQVVMIVGIAAVILALIVFVLWPEIKKWTKSGVDDITKFKKD